ncbi:ABC-F family ATP-binding cassette domain-containing protein [bacterium]|nr:ABC-F family ATP-binding cassette domain-containing protein [bacterium]RQV97205.1 MAG: ABC transporter ATP-binding protein [bacterium]
MIQIRNLHYAIGERNLLDGIDWMIHPGKHVALIGPNGTGKTTLLKILGGELRSDSGEITAPKNTTIGYLPQEEASLKEGSLIESVFRQQKEIYQTEKQIHHIQQKLKDNPDPESALLDKLGYLEHHYSALGGYDVEHRMKTILSGLGFRESDFNRSLSEFSGGWRMRSVLAGLLLQNPDILLLDEPTNHLDLPSLEWLEQYLLQFRGSVVIVSHDRFFIDRLVTDIYELESGRMIHYPGNYHFYEEKKAEHLGQLRKQWKDQQEEIRRLKVFIDRFRYKATKAAQVQSRIKELEKIKQVELPPERQSWTFKIKAGKSSYKDVLHIENMSFRYQNEKVLDQINLDLYRGEKIALVGENGAGKTTLTRLINGDLKPKTGRVILGRNVHIGYYSQHQIDALDLKKTVIEEVCAYADETITQHVRNVLGIFQFSGDDIFKQIRVLSGGEKARVSLAKMLLSGANLLIMDEPTNHLDIISKEALEQALLVYDGTMLLISHDRYFLTKLVHQVVEIRNHTLRIYEGNYYNYLEKRITEENALSRTARPSGLKPNHQDQIAGSIGKKTRTQRRQEAEARDALNRLKKPIETDIRQIENQIEILESKKQDLEMQMARPETYTQAGFIRQLQKEHKDVERELMALYSGWENAHEKLESLMKSQNQ